MTRDSIALTGALGPIGPYSSAIRVGGQSAVIFASGQLPLDEDTGNIEVAEMSEQVAQALRNAFRVVEEAGGGTARDIVKVTVFVTDLMQAESINAAYTDCFAEPFPARTMVEVSRLPKGALVEVDVIAVTSS